MLQRFIFKVYIFIDQHRYLNFIFSRLIISQNSISKIVFHFKKSKLLLYLSIDRVDGIVLLFWSFNSFKFISTSICRFLFRCLTYKTFNSLMRAWISHIFNINYLLRFLQIAFLLACVKVKRFRRLLTWIIVTFQNFLAKIKL